MTDLTDGEATGEKLISPSSATIGRRMDERSAADLSDEPVPNTPKPGPWMFYALQEDGQELCDDTDLRRDDRLRGRKYYLPHPDSCNDPDDWTLIVTALSVSGSRRSSDPQVSSRHGDSVLTLGPAQPLGFDATHVSAVEEEAYAWWVVGGPRRSLPKLKGTAPPLPYNHEQAPSKEVPLMATLINATPQTVWVALEFC